MIVLALDTAMAACSAAVYDTTTKELMAHHFSEMSKGHADAIAPMVAQAMGDARIGFGELARIAVTIGPGTFTGVRTGLAMARGLGLALHIPVTGIDTLSAIACNVGAGESPIAVAADARRGEVYFALFAADHSLVHRPAVLAVKEAAARLPLGRIRVVGTGAEVLAQAAAPDRHLTRVSGDLPRASAFVQKMSVDKASDTPPEPLYLRPPDAKPQPGRSRSYSFDIKRAGSESADLLAALHRECFDNPWSELEIARLVAMPGASALIAASQGEPCAFVIVRKAADEAEILTLGTRPFARRRGAARSLINALNAALIHGGATSLFIEVAAGNEPARRLYQSLGFIVAGNRQQYYERPGGLPEDAIVMRRDLTS